MSQKRTKTKEDSMKPKVVINPALWEIVCREKWYELEALSIGYEYDMPKPTHSIWRFERRKALMNHARKQIERVDQDVNVMNNPHTYRYQRMPRNFNRIVREKKLTTKGSCGLFPYIALRSLAFQADSRIHRYYKQKVLKEGNDGFDCLKVINLIIRIESLAKVFSCSEQRADEILDNLVDLGLIYYVKSEADGGLYLINVIGFETIFSKSMCHDAYMKKTMAENDCSSRDVIIAHSDTVPLDMVLGDTEAFLGAYTQIGYYFTDKEQIQRTFYNKGFFFSEADVIADIWLHSIYRDPYVSDRSMIAPIFFPSQRTVRTVSATEGTASTFDDLRGKDMVTVPYLTERWGCSRSRVIKLMKKLERLELITVQRETGRGSRIFVPKYNEVMWFVKNQIPECGDNFSVRDPRYQAEKPKVPEDTYIRKNPFDDTLTDEEKEEFLREYKEDLPRAPEIAHEDVDLTMLSEMKLYEWMVKDGFKQATENFNNSPTGQPATPTIPRAWEPSIDSITLDDFENIEDKEEFVKVEEEELDKIAEYEEMLAKEERQAANDPEPEPELRGIHEAVFEGNTYVLNLDDFEDIDYDDPYEEEGVWTPVPALNEESSKKVSDYHKENPDKKMPRIITTKSIEETKKALDLRDVDMDTFTEADVIRIED